MHKATNQITMLFKSIILAVNTSNKVYKNLLQLSIRDSDRFIIQTTFQTRTKLVNNLIRKDKMISEMGRLGNLNWLLVQVS